MSIIEKLNTQVACDRASIRAVARACGATVAEMDEDMGQPDPNLVEFPPGTVACCNRCQELHPLPKPVAGRRVGRAYRLEMCMLGCSHLDAHWVHPGDQERRNGN